MPCNKQFNLVLLHLHYNPDFTIQTNLIVFDFLVVSGGSTISQVEGANLLTNFSRKLHKNEEILSQVGRPLRPLDLPLAVLEK